MAYDNKVAYNPNWKNMVEVCYIIWDGNHRVKEWMNLLHNKFTKEEKFPYINYGVVKFESSKTTTMLLSFCEK